MSLDQDIPVEHRGNHLFSLLEMNHPKIGIALTAVTGEIGKCVEPEDAAISLSKSISCKFTVLMTFRGVSPKAALKLENFVKQAHAITGLTRNGLLQVLVADRQ